MGSILIRWKPYHHRLLCKYEDFSKTAAKVHKSQAPILRSIKSKLGANQISKEQASLNKVFLICYINTQSGPYKMRVANYFQMFETKFTL